MKAKSLLFGLPLLCMACGNPTNDDANDAAGTGDAYLAKEVVGVHALTPDDRYQPADHYLTEEFIRSNFKLEESVELKETSETNGVAYEWGGNEVGLTFGHYRPFPTMYAAENDFNERYQPELVAAMDKLPKKPYSNGGPASQGLASEFPELNGTSAMVKRDTVAAKDTATTSPGVSAATSVSVAPAQSSGKFLVVEGVGDKAVWEPATKTLHVLYNNHIVNIRVSTKDSQAVQQQRAATIASVIIGEVTE